MNEQENLQLAAERQERADRAACEPSPRVAAFLKALAELSPRCESCGTPLASSETLCAICRRGLDAMEAALPPLPPAECMYCRCGEGPLFYSLEQPGVPVCGECLTNEPMEIGPLEVAEIEGAQK